MTFYYLEQSDMNKNHYDFRPTILVVE